MGDQGRRGWLQNLPNGPFETAPFVDDTYGGPEPDNAHLSGVILRLNDDGTAPTDNPFFAVGAAMGGEVGANIQKIFSYGHRNGFGMAFDPYSGHLWETENGDDAFSELNRVEAGMNGGWIQIAGPQHRFFDFKTIETTMFGGALQQVRYPPTRLADAPGLALARLFMLPGAKYSRSRAELEIRVRTGGNDVRAWNCARRGERRHALDRIFAQLSAGRWNRRQLVPVEADAQPDASRRL